jgi:hypothetical protein
MKIRRNSSVALNLSFVTSQVSGIKKKFRSQTAYVVAGLDIN